MPKIKPAPRESYVVVAVTTVFARSPMAAERIARKMSVSSMTVVGKCSFENADKLSNKCSDLFYARNLEFPF